MSFKNICSQINYIKRYGTNLSRAQRQRRLSSRLSRRQSERARLTASSRAFTPREFLLLRDRRVIKGRKPRVLARDQFKSSDKFPGLISFDDRTKSRGGEMGCGPEWLRRRSTDEEDEELRVTRGWPPARQVPDDTVRQWRESFGDQSLNTRRIPIAMRTLLGRQREIIG